MDPSTEAPLHARSHTTAPCLSTSAANVAGQRKTCTLFGRFGAEARPPEKLHPRNAGEAQADRRSRRCAPMLEREARRRDRMHSSHLSRVAAPSNVSSCEASALTGLHTKTPPMDQHNLPPNILFVDDLRKGKATTMQTTALRACATANTATPWASIKGMYAQAQQSEAQWHDQNATPQQDRMQAGSPTHTPSGPSNLRVVWPCKHDGRADLLTTKRIHN